MMIKNPNKKCFVCITGNKGIDIYYNNGLDFMGGIYISKKIKIGYIMSQSIKHGLTNKPSILLQHD